MLVDGHIARFIPRTYRIILGSSKAAFGAPIRGEFGIADESAETGLDAAPDLVRDASDARTVCGLG